jgi:hypothetical protein
MGPAPNIKCSLLAYGLSVGTLVTGCAITPNTVASASEVRAADELEVDEFPQAEVHMQLAKEQMKLAANMAPAGADSKQSVEIIIERESPVSTRKQKGFY